MKICLFRCRFLSPGTSLKLTLFLMLVPGSLLLGYPSYHDPNLDDQGYCSTCHSGFAGGRSDTLHSLHTGNPDPVTTNCNLCHDGTGRDNPLTLWSVGDNDDGLGCAGCHGRDYGETISADYRGLGINGLAKNSGVGLRKHHAANGISLCGTCHSSDPNPYPENVIDPGLGNTTHYYFRTDVELGGSPVDPSINEDSGNDSGTQGLDNDGDNIYDGLDPDTVMSPDQVFIERLPSGGLHLTWPTPSPSWVLQRNSILDSNWINLPVPLYTQRVNGMWFVDILSPLDPKQFYRLNLDLPLPPILSAKETRSVKARSQPRK